MGSDAGEDARTFCPCSIGGVRLFSFFWISQWNASLKEMWEGNSYGEEKITNIPITASLLCHLLPFLLFSVWLREAGELHTLARV